MTTIKSQPKALLLHRLYALLSCHSPTHAYTYVRNDVNQVFASLVYAVNVHLQIRMLYNTYVCCDSR